MTIGGTLNTSEIPDDDRMFEWIAVRVHIDHGDGRGVVVQREVAPFFALQWMLKELRKGPLEDPPHGTVHRLEIITDNDEETTT